MVYELEHLISVIEPDFTIKQGIGKSFYDKNTYVALQAAQEYGEIFTLPEFLKLRMLTPFDDFLWNVPMTLQTEEIFGKTKLGNPVAIMVHGAGLLTPERVKAGIKIEDFTDDPPNHGLTKTASGLGEHALKLEEKEIFDLLEGKTPSGDIDIYSFSDFARMKDLPRRYAVVREVYPNAQPSDKDYHSNQMMGKFSCAGGVYKLLEYYGITDLATGNAQIEYSPIFQHINLDQPQARFLQIHGKHQLAYNLMQMDGSARFLAVKRDSLQEKIDETIILEQ